MIKLVDATDKERLFIVGDLHGRYDILHEFLQWSKAGDKDLLVSVGDLIDRGSKSLECLSHFLFADNCEAVKGNHDQLMVDSLVNNDRQADMTWMMNGGDWALSHNLNYLRGLATETDKLPVFLDITFGDVQVGVSHAEFPYTSRGHLLDARTRNMLIATACTVNVAILDMMVDEAKDIKLALWGRRQVKESGGRGILGYDYVVHGHTVTQVLTDEPVPIQKVNQHWIDTGSCFTGGRQTIMEIKKDGTFEYHQLWFDDYGELCIV